MRLIRCLTIAITAGLSLATTTSFAEQGENPHQCFFARNMRGWTAVDKKSFVIRATGGRCYLFNIKGLCPSLKFARVVGLQVKQHQSVWRHWRICSGRTATLLYRQHAGTDPAGIPDVEGPLKFRQQAS